MNISVIGLYLGFITPGLIWVAIGIACYFIVTVACRISRNDRIRRPDPFSIPVVLAWHLLRAIIAHAILGDSKNQAAMTHVQRRMFKSTILSGRRHYFLPASRLLSYWF